MRLKFRAQRQRFQMHDDMLNKLGLLQINLACRTACLNDRFSMEAPMGPEARVRVAGRAAWP